MRATLTSLRGQPEPAEVIIDGFFLHGRPLTVREFCEAWVNNNQMRMFQSLQAHYFEYHLKDNEPTAQVFLKFYEADVTDVYATKCRAMMGIPFEQFLSWIRTLRPEIYDDVSRFSSVKPMIKLD